MAILLVREGETPPEARRRPRSEERLFRLALAVGLTATAGWAYASHTLAPPSPGVARREIPAYELPPAPQAEPSSPLRLPHEAWLSDVARVRAAAPLSRPRTERLTQLFADAAALFPAFAGRPEQALEPVELRLVGRDLLNDPAYFDMGGGPAVLGLYFTRANVAYVVPADGRDEQAVLHELAHYFSDVYELHEVDVWLEEAESEGFARWVSRYRRLLEEPHVAKVAPPAPKRLRHIEPISASLTLRAAAPPSPLMVRWILRVAATAREVLPAAAASPIELRLHDAAGCRAQAAGNVVELWLGGCPAREPRRAVDELTHAIGHVWAAGGADEEKVAYTLGRHVTRLLAQRRQSLRPDAF